MSTSVSIPTITARLARLLQAASLGLLAASSLTVAGCGDPPLDPNEYGQVIRGLPEVEGADERYPLPQLGPPDEQKQRKFHR